MNNRINWILLPINLLLVVIILFALFISFKINLLDRSLWQDEAMLAFSISKRNFFNLSSDILEWWQSAPVLYLYIVKLITVIFGESEFTLRIWSYIMFCATLSSLYYVLHTILKVKVPLFGVAFMSGISIMIVYSNELKPYMTDCFSVLFIVICYYWSQREKISRSALNILFALFVWLSNPVCFFIASIILIDFFEGLVEKDKEKIKKSILSASISFFSFVIYFFYWLKPVMDLGHMSEYWQNNKFSIILSKHNLHLLKEVFKPLGIYNVAIVSLSSIGCVLNIFILKNKYINILTLGVVVCLIASYLGLYPMQDRMLLFVYPIIGILLFFIIDKASVNFVSDVIFILLSFILLLFSSSLLQYQDSNQALRSNEEFNPAYYYLLENLKENDKVYVYNHTIPVFCFKNKFDTLSIGDYFNNVILGADDFDNEKNIEDINLISEKQSIYILAVHTPPQRINPLLDSLNIRGNLTIVHNYWNTPLYHYSSRIHY